MRTCWEITLPLLSTSQMRSMQFSSTRWSSRCFTTIMRWETMLFHRTTTTIKTTSQPELAPRKKQNIRISTAEMASRTMLWCWKVELNAIVKPASTISSTIVFTVVELCANKKAQDLVCSAATWCAPKKSKEWSTHNRRRVKTWRRHSWIRRRRKDSKRR